MYYFEYLVNLNSQDFNTVDKPRYYVAKWKITMQIQMILTRKSVHIGPFQSWLVLLCEQKHNERIDKFPSNSAHTSQIDWKKIYYRFQKLFHLPSRWSLMVLINFLRTNLQQSSHKIHKLPDGRLQKFKCEVAEEDVNVIKTSALRDFCIQSNTTERSVGYFGRSLPMVAAISRTRLSDWGRSDNAVHQIFTHSPVHHIFTHSYRLRPQR